MSALPDNGGEALSGLGGVPATRTIAGLDLSADRTAAAMRTAMTLPTTAPSPSATGGVLILDPDDASSLTLVSGRISAMASQVGGLTVAQSTAGSRPLLVPGGLGGRAIVSHTSARSDELTITNAAMYIADPILLAVVRVTTYAGWSAIVAVADSAPAYARWSMWWASSSASDMRIDTDTTTNTCTRGGGEVISTWTVVAYRVKVRQVYTDGKLVTDAADRTPTYGSPPYVTEIFPAGGEWAWIGIYDGATALSGTTFADWAVAQSALLAARFGLQCRPS